MHVCLATGGGGESTQSAKDFVDKIYIQSLHNESSLESIDRIEKKKKTKNTRFSFFMIPEKLKNI